jgi:hypothetical protein
MWWTPNGQRTLSQAEAKLIRELVASAYDEVDLSDDMETFQTGISVFDRLESAQQLALLLEVGEALLQSDVPPPELTAVREAVIAVLFLQLSRELEIEMEDRGTYWRELMRAAYLEQNPDDSEVPPPHSDDLDEWTMLAECLEGRLLWDDDYAAEDTFVDQSPDQIAAMKQWMGISDDYFTAIAPDPLPDELESIRRRLDSLTRE